MRIVRYTDRAGAAHWGVEDVSGAVRRMVGDPFSGKRDLAEPADIASMLPPVAPPSVYCIGLNYRDHAIEYGSKIPSHPVVFMKSPTAIIRTGDTIEIPRFLASHQVDYEAELVVVIGRRCKNVRPSDSLSYVLGYCCGNDVSARDWQKEWGGGQFCRAKTFDTFAPIGPWLVTADEVPDVQRLGLRTRVNGKQVQNGNTSDMLFPVAELVSFLSGSTTLLPGTAIFTGTPAGVGGAKKPPEFLAAGDAVEVEVDGLGVLKNRVEDERV